MMLLFGLNHILFIYLVYITPDWHISHLKSRKQSFSYYGNSTIVCTLADCMNNNVDYYRN